MVDSKETSQESLKKLLKNKRTVKGTPLYRYANRYAGYFVLALGCAHVSIGYITSKINVSDYWLTSGIEYTERRGLEVGMHQTIEDNTQMKINELKEDFNRLFPYPEFEVMSNHFYNLKEKFFSSSTADAASESPETTKEASLPTGSSSNGSVMKDKSQ